jgi:hypothetical protein
MNDETIPQWEIRTLKHAYTPRPPTEYIVDQFFAKASLNGVYGAPGSLKSMILADACAHIVAGTNWLPGFEGTGISVKKTAVLWVDLDNGTRRTDERMEAVSRANNLPEDAPLYYVSMPVPPLIAHDVDSILMLRDLIWQYEAELVVIDNLGNITGDIEENSSGMAIVMGNLRQLAERTGAAIVVIHHQRKGGAAGGRAGDALRGHSSIEAALDLAIHIVREPNSLTISGRSTKTRGVDVPDFMADFYYEHRDGTNDLSRAWFDGKAFRRGENTIRDEILATVESYGEIGKTKLVEVVKDALGQDAPGVNKIRAWLDDMIATTGELKESKEGNYRVITLQ